MSRKLAVIMIAIAVTMAFAASMAIAGDPPAQITIDKAMAKKPGVAFDHAKHAGTIDCMKKIVQQEGPSAFFKGSLSNVIRGTGGALVLVFYSKIEAILFG